MSYRAPNRSQQPDLLIEYETRPSDTTQDTTFFVSQDGRRGARKAINVAEKRRKIRPTDLEDYFSTLREDDTQEEPEGVDEGDAESGDKRKRYDTSATMGAWRPYVQRFLDGLIKRQAQCADDKCPCCGDVWAVNARRFRCTDCGEFVQCLKCTLSRHTLTPLHRIKEWRGTFWVPSSINVLGGIYQLGHGGHACPRPAPVACTMVVVDCQYIHSVKVRYCGCDQADRAQDLDQLLANSWYPATITDPATCATFSALELYRLFNVVGNINVHDFIGTVERLTDPAQVNKVPDRYKAFGLMSRQWAFLMRLLRAGRGHDPAGVANTKNGECGALCWTCPHDKINIPEGWQDVSPEFRPSPKFLYMLLLAMDANFRLKSRLRSNARDDPPLGDGWGHLVEEGPYKKHLRGYVAEKDVSTCIAFAALMQKDTRMTTGLRCSGVGGVVCARHKLVRPQGVGDLQKGERYSNMDYILLCAVLGIMAMYLVILYDIACQWRIHFEERMGKMPEELQLDLKQTTVLYGLPVWHAAAHERSCQVQNSLSYVPGVGRTDGEGTTLPRKLILAIEERDRQVAAFIQVDAMLKKDLRKTWQKQVDDWLEDRTKPNPYTLADGADGPSEAAIRLMLTREEAQEAATGGAKLDGSSVTSFLTAGLQLEESQRRIKREVKGRTLLASDLNERIAEMRLAFFSKLLKFRKLQAVHMPGAVREVENEEDARDPDLPPPKAEDVVLYLPSGLQSAVREGGCRGGLPAMEAKLREGQCRDALRAATRANSLIDRVGERVDAAAAKYRGARQALLSLRSAEACTSWKELKAVDIQLDEERDVDSTARKKLGLIGSKFRRRGAGTISSRDKTFSWIWTEGGGPGEDEQALHDSVRVEWSKAKARKERWEEETGVLIVPDDNEQFKLVPQIFQIFVHAVDDN
ncbi:hypothetical protein C8F04DRAFT_1264960 [Mycena alexandri]|uniref:CxC2-like cysteine cluster KDZ transposase-associated domain-containing protein n=1 Tax=Mycena alexandri TaxID=1745969 RepID=A0AAD6SKZ6_9AGAR|nr:hypothetical protein C8F04DRAFT_1264960 [Mycena alexandri]